MLSRQTLDVLYKLRVRSVIDYALPVYCTTLTKTQLGKPSKEKTGNILVFYQSGVPPPSPQ